MVIYSEQLWYVSESMKTFLVGSQRPLVVSPPPVVPGDADALGLVKSPRATNGLLAPHSDSGASDGVTPPEASGVPVVAEVLVQHCGGAHLRLSIVGLGSDGRDDGEEDDEDGWKRRTFD